MPCSKQDPGLSLLLVPSPWLSGQIIQPIVKHAPVKKRGSLSANFVCQMLTVELVWIPSPSKNTGASGLSEMILLLSG